MIRLLTVAVLLIILWAFWPKKQTFMKNPEKKQTEIDFFPEIRIRANPWIGFLQEDVYKDPSGPIGNFVGKEDSSPVPMYSFTS